MKIRVEFISQKTNAEPKTTVLMFGSMDDYAEWARNRHYHNITSTKVETID